MIEVRLLGPGEESILTRCADEVFDYPIHMERAKEFLADERHHIAVALEGDMVVGFASAVHYVHPDKPQPELWINEVSVAPQWRRRGVGQRLVRALLAKAQQLGCREAWVLTEQANEPANALYKSLAGEASDEAPVMYTFHIEP